MGRFIPHLLRSSWDAFLDIGRETGLNAEARDTVDSVDALRLNGLWSDVSMDRSEGEPADGDSTPTNVGELTSARRARGTNVGVPTPVSYTHLTLPTKRLV